MIAPAEAARSIRPNLRKRADRNAVAVHTAYKPVSTILQPWRWRWSYVEDEDKADPSQRTR